MRLHLSIRRVALGAALVLFTTTSSSNAASTNQQRSFKVPVGLQLYSLRNQFSKDVPGTLDEVRDFGIKTVELAGTYNLKPEEFKTQLDARGLKAMSGHFPYERFRDDVEGIAREAKALGMEYVGCAWIPHQDPFTEDACRTAAAVFNKAGEALAAHGLKFFYHVHGFEFQPAASGTLFDLLMKETNPKFVSFEMDVFWVVYPGQDPVKLLNQYGARWQLLHVKGMRDSTQTGLLTGHTDVNNDVAVGSGKIDYRPILEAAKTAGVKWCFIEDESSLSEQQIPKSLDYLSTLAW